MWLFITDTILAIPCRSCVHSFLAGIDGENISLLCAASIGTTTNSTFLFFSFSLYAWHEKGLMTRSHEKTRTYSRFRAISRYKLPPVNFFGIRFFLVLLCPMSQSGLFSIQIKKNTEKINIKISMQNTFILENLELWSDSELAMYNEFCKCYLTSISH